jgi:small subunit ribosomal protein S1
MAGTEVESDTSPVKEEENIQTQLQEEYLKTLEQLEEGQLIEGRVIQITPDQVFVDVGYKSEGKIPISEFTDVPNIGDTVPVVLVTKENKHGEVIVSKQKADAKIFWKNLRLAYQDKRAVEGIIEKQVKGGFDVNLGTDVHAFLPVSQSDIQKVDKPEKILNLKISAYVERLYSDGKINIVVNRRKYMEEELERKRNEFFENTPVGSDVHGAVKSFTSFGAFIDLGGFDGLLHINDMSWGHVTRPKDFVKKGQEIQLKVIRIDRREKRINLSLKHFSDDPWVHFEEKYHVNDIIKGKVTKLTDFGAFIELEEGIEGLAHISEFSWVRKVQKAQEMVKPGDIVECMILGYDLQAGRVSLGLKQVKANPWEAIEEKYPVGTRITRKVVKLTGAGAFIALDEGIDGFLHTDDISWIRKTKSPGGGLSAGQEIEVMVISVDRENRNIRLGIKQLSEDPWKNFADAYKPGSPVEGEVASVTDFGIFVRIPGGIEGLIHKTNLVENRKDDPDDALKKYKAGDRIKAIVLEVQADRQKVAFSIRDYQKKVQREEISRYMAEEESSGSTYTLGAVLKSKSSSDGTSSDDASSEGTSADGTSSEGTSSNSEDIQGGADTEE